MGLLGAAIVALGWWYLFISKTRRRWSIGLPLLIGPGGFFTSMQQVPVGTWSPITGLVYATLVALMMAFVGGIIDFGLRYRNRSGPTVEPDKGSIPSAAVHHDANHEILGISPDAGPEEITAAYQAMMQKHLRQSGSASLPSLPPYQDQSRSTTIDGGKTALNLALFLGVPIAVVMGVVWLGSNSGSGGSSSDTANETRSPAIDECYSLVEAQKYDEAIAPCRQAAEQGDAAAQVNLGWLYDAGFGVPEDDVEAVKWYHLAADQGNATAQYNLGLMYDNGTGVPEDDTEAVKWYRLAADQGDADAKARLEVLQSSEKLESSAASLSSGAEANLTRDDFLEAERIAHAGYANAKVSHLVGPDIPGGALYRGFIIGLDPSSADALAVKGEFATAALLYLGSYSTNGDPDAAHNLGLMYSRGLGVQKDRSKALKFLTFSQSNRRWDADSWEIERLSR